MSVRVARGLRAWPARERTGREPERKNESFFFPGEEVRRRYADAPNGPRQTRRDGASSALVPSQNGFSNGFSSPETSNAPNRRKPHRGALAASYFASSRARRASPAPRTTRGTARAARPPADSSRTIHAPTVANISTATIHGHEHESRRCANHPQRRACSVSHLGSCKVCVF